MRFVRERPEVEIVAFEFRTGAGVPSRIDWHVDRLCRIADAAGRPLTLVVRGGAQVLHRLKRHFGQVILVETDAFARTLKRRRAEFTKAGRLRWPRYLSQGRADRRSARPQHRNQAYGLLLPDFAPVARSERPARDTRLRHSTLTVKPGRGAFWRSWTRPWRLGLWPQISSA